MSRRSSKTTKQVWHRITKISLITNIKFKYIRYEGIASQREKTPAIRRPPAKQPMHTTPTTKGKKGFDPFFTNRTPAFYSSNQLNIHMLLLPLILPSLLCCVYNITEIKYNKRRPPQELSWKFARKNPLAAKRPLPVAAEIH